MLGIYAVIKNSTCSKYIKLDTKNYKNFSFIDFETEYSIVRLVYPLYKENRCYYKEGKSWLLIDGNVFINKNEVSAKDLFQLAKTDTYSSLEGLNGEYLISYFDGDSLFFISDRMGQRQHCISQSENYYSIAPTPGECLSLINLEKKLNEKVLYFFMNSKKLRLNQETIWKNCSVLEPASTLEFDIETLKKRIYWKLSYTNERRNFDIDDLVKLYKDSVNKRTLSDKNKLLTLTGGLDSRTMVCAIDKSNLSNLEVITAGIKNCTEVQYAKQVSEKLSLKHSIYNLEAEDIYSEESLSYFKNEDIDLLIQGMWFPFLNKFQEKDYLLHGLDLDVTIGGIYLTDDVFNINNIEGLFTYIKDEAFISLETASKLFKKDKHDKFYPIIDSFINSSIDKCKENTFQETYDHLIMRYSMNRVILQRYRGIRNKIDTISPMYDNDLIDYYREIPIDLRKNYQIFQPFLLKTCGDISKVPYQRTNLPGDTPIKFWKKSQRIEKDKEELYRRIAYETKGKSYIPYLGYYTNVDEWLRFNKLWIKATKNLLQSTTSLIRKDWLNEKYLDQIISEHQNHEVSHMSTLLRLMSAEIFLRLANKQEISEIRRSIISE